MGLSWFQIRPKVSYLSVSRPSKRQAVNDDDKVMKTQRGEPHPQGVADKKTNEENLHQGLAGSIPVAQTWNLSKILHTQIFRVKVLHRKSA